MAEEKPKTNVVVEAVKTIGKALLQPFKLIKAFWDAKA